MVSRRRALSALSAWAGAAVLGCGEAWRGSTTGPTCGGLAGRRIRWIVPNAPGGGYDAESRLIEPFLEQRLGAEIAIDNVPGAGGILGARAIAAAAPDGLTLGVVGVPGLLVAALSRAAGAPNPASDLTILGRISRSYHVWATGRNSGLETLDDALAAAEVRPLVFAINEVGSASFVSITATASVLDVNVEIVAGFGGTRAASLAAVRGDVDLVGFNFDTIVDLIDAGELRPLLQVSLSRIAPHQSLDGVAILGGEDGWALRRTRARGRDIDQTRRHTQALVDVMGAGRVAVGPARLDTGLSACLSRTLHETLTDARVLAASSRTLDAASARVAQDDVQRAAAEAPLLLPDLEAAMRRVRQ